MLLVKKIGLVLLGVVVGALSVTYGVTASQAQSQTLSESCTPVARSHSAGGSAEDDGKVYRCLVGVL